ncbi:TonB-dependent receptor plug domain-containing protein [Pseudoflavitalea sp. X16]|uniref:M56 family metallopeptidase n=1 Tax=Paraflavitalea devenefica TaxID=2716334 RepID=UPI00141E73C6|nr:M56 family metallopeptidase [Paraflavitalea devenefica]NII25011.1 TonB-dependent receptor plug domain-containing protein [Paraflavitalea devenefica]
MPYIAQYLLKLSISLAVVYLFYALVLRRLTFYTWNRWYLLGYSLLAFFIPFVNISPFLERGDWTNNQVVQLIPLVSNYQGAPATPSGQPDGWTLFLLLLIAGIVIMLIRLLVQYLSFRHIRRSSQLLSGDTVKIYQVDKNIIPFSFGRSIFINQHQHNEEELKEIIRHEFIHVKQRHTVDILWGELLCMLNWYNPFVWLIRKAIRQNLEFIADHKVLEAGLDRKQYQYLLLKVVGAPAFAIASQFNFSSLKKRIAMMNKMRSAKIHLIKFLFVLPLVTILLLAFRNAAINHKALAAIMPATTITMVAEDMKAPTPLVTDTVPRKGKVEHVQADPARTVIITARYDSARYFIDASLNGPGNPYRALLPANVLYFIDGVEQPKGGDVVNNLAPGDIERVDVLKGKSAITLYGEKGTDGVILITTKKGTPAPQPVLPPVKDTIPPQIITLKIDTNKDNKDIQLCSGPFLGVLVVDGEIYDSVRLHELKPENIERMDVLKNAEDVKQYGPKAKYGVIKITTKKRDNKITAAPIPAGTPTQADKLLLKIDARQESNEPF